MIKNSIETKDSLSNVRVCTVVGKWQGGMPFHYGLARTLSEIIFHAMFSVSQGSHG